MALKSVESQDIEFKSNWRDEYLKVICAFANADGGKLIIGIDDKGKAIGVENAKKLLEDVPNKIRNKLGIIPSVEVRNKKGKKILVINIDPSSVPITYDGRYYLRSGSNSFELKGHELNDFIIKKIGKTWDEFIEEKASFDDIEPADIEKFKNLAGDRVPSVAKEKDYKNILKKLFLLQDRRLKKAAVLLFGKNPQKYYPNAFLKIGKFLTEADILTSDIIEGNLFNQLENAIEILRTKYLISRIYFEGIYRKEKLEYPEEALREAIINAVIHRDYLGTSAIQIRVYNDRLVVMNEGKLPPEVPIEKLKKEHLSKPRNVLLANTFYKAGLIESWGRGTIKIVENCIKQGLPEPDFIEEYGVMKVVFYKDKFTEDYLKKIGVNDRQIKAVMYVKGKRKITNREYQKEFSVSRQTATRDLTELVEKKLFKLQGTGKRDICYVLIA